MDANVRKVLHENLKATASRRNQTQYLHNLPISAHGHEHLPILGGDRRAT
jgi:hypothetical protein